MKPKISIFVLLFAMAGLNSCYYDKEEILYQISPGCDTSEISFKNTIYPIINNSCNISGCHDAVTKSAGYNFETYAGIKSQINEPRFLGSIKHESPYSAMPKGANKLSACELMKIEQWKKNGSPDN